MTTIDLTRSDIRNLRAEAGTAGDLATVALCELVLDGDYGDAEPGTEMDMLREQGVTPEQAMARIVASL